MTTPDAPPVAAPGAVAAAIDVGIDALARRAIDLLGSSRRIVIGIAGSPGAGKTTLAVKVAARIDELAGDVSEGPQDARQPFAVHLPMDGYHLANSTLKRLGRHDRKGAIDTFDGWGYVALLRRLTVEVEHTIYAPSFDRRVEEGIAGEIAIPSSARIVLTEGNYLLVDEEPWAPIAGLVAESWFCETGDAERVRRLVDRHERGGRTPEAAAAWATSVDGKNAVLIESTAPRADIRISGVDASIVV